MRLPVRRLLAAAVTALVVAPVLTAPAAAGPKAHPPGTRMTVMTRNLYLGADINRPVLAALAAGSDPNAVLVALANATHTTREIVDDTNYPVRAELLADEIVQARPDLVGLQEVALWRSEPLELLNVGVPDAQTVDLDFLQILLDALEARGVEYVAARIGNRADVEAPSFTGSPFDGTLAQGRDVRLTMRDVILQRVDSDLTVTGGGDRIFAANLMVPLLGRVLHFDRGFQWLDVHVGDSDVRFVNSHFEAFRSNLALAQGAELVAAMPTDRKVVFVCDCNSDPLNSSIKPMDTVAHKAAYELITGVGGFTDQWLEKTTAENGWTSGLSETVDDATAAGFDHRIDMIFTRDPSGAPMGADRGGVVGNEIEDRDPVTGLWPSDHAGVFLRLRGF